MEQDHYLVQFNKEIYWRASISPRGKYVRIHKPSLIMDLVSHLVLFMFRVDLVPLWALQVASLISLLQLPSNVYLGAVVKRISCLDSNDYGYIWSVLYTCCFLIFTESQNCLDWKGPLEIIWSEPTAMAGSPRADYTGTYPGGLNLSREGDSTMFLGSALLSSEWWSSSPCWGGTSDVSVYAPLV